MYVQVMTNASGHQVWCKKQLPTGPVHMFSLKKGKVTMQEAFRNRTEFFIHNGTLKITNIERNDAGQYNVEAYDPNGVRVKNINVTLDVQGKCLISLCNIIKNLMSNHHGGVNIQCILCNVR